MIEVEDEAGCNADGGEEGGMGLSVLLRRNSGRDLPDGQRLAKLVTVIALVGNQGVGGRQAWIEKLSAHMVVHLPFGQQFDQWLTFTEQTSLTDTEQVTTARLNV